MKRTVALGVAMLSAGLMDAASAADGDANRRAVGSVALQGLTGEHGLEVVDGLRVDFPFLADSIVDFAYGEVISRQVLDPRTRQVATVSALAAQGALGPQLKVHFHGALNVGVSPEALKEVVYLTAVYAGFPRAINAATVLSEVLEERRASTPVDAVPSPAEPPHRE